MATNFLLTFDSAAPAGGAVLINAGAVFTTSVDVSVAITSTDPSTVGYQVKIYGDVDDAFAPAQYRALEANAPWVSLASPHLVRVAAGDGVKTVRVKIRDDVLNPSGELTDTITLDTSAPVPNVTAGPTPARISEQATKDTASFTWSVDTTFEEYKIKVVTNAGDAHTAGAQIPTTAGSTNMSGAAGGYPAATGITSTIKGTDLKAALAGDGDKRVKVFVRDAVGNWSV